MRYTPNSLENQWMPFSGNREFKNSPRLLVKAEGMYYENHEGQKILDGSSGLFNCCAGHGRMEIIDAIYEQLKQCAYAPPFQVSNPASFELANKVTRLTPDSMNHVFFTNSGSESIDTAIKMVMAYHRAKGDAQRVRFISRERAYHGVNIGGTSLAGMVKNRETFSGLMPNVSHIRHTLKAGNEYQWGCPDDGAELAEDLQRQVELYGGSTIAAVFVEPLAGSTGVLVPPKGYLNRLRQICDENGILLIFDEVICGFGRMAGANFGSQAFGVTPDIMTLAKALTNGYQPMGAVVAQDSIYDTIVNAAPEDAIEFFHGYTYSGSPGASAAGNAALDLYEKEGLFEKCEKLTPYFRDAMMSLKGCKQITDIRGYGLMCGVEINGDGAAMQRQLFHDGLHVKFTGNVGIFAPAFIAEEKHVDDIVAKLHKHLN